MRFSTSHDKHCPRRAANIVATALCAVLCNECEMFVQIDVLRSIFAIIIFSSLSQHGAQRRGYNAADKTFVYWRGAVYLENPSAFHWLLDGLPANADALDVQLYRIRQSYPELDLEQALYLCFPSGRGSDEEFNVRLLEITAPTLVGASGWDEDDLQRGIVYAGVFTNTRFSLDAPDDAVVHDKWRLRGAH